MDFIGLCGRMVREAGISGDGPTDITGNVGEYQRVVDWINQSYLEIQLEHPNFAWMLGTVQFNTTDGKADYSPTECGITDHGRWGISTFRCYETASGFGSEMFLSPVTYESWRNTYQFSSYRTVKSRPTVIAEGDIDHKLLLGPAPLAGYTVIGQYWRTPSYMTTKNEVPLLPERYHMAIVYRALMEYGAYESAPEVFQRGEQKYRQMLTRIESDQAPRISLGGALC